LADRDVGLQSDILPISCNYFNSNSMLNHLGTLITLANPTFSGDSVCNLSHKSHFPFARVYGTDMQLNLSFCS
jgi:hypothetical protein